MSVTFTVNYKEIYSTKTVEKIEELLEDSYDLDDMLTFIDENSEADFVAHYEDYCSAGESIGYDVVDAFVKHHGDMCYVENVEEAFRGVYNSEEDFAEEHYEQVYGEVPVMLVVDWEATWKSSLSYDYDFVDGYVFDRNF
jgi:antirestriction protein